MRIMLPMGSNDIDWLGHVATYIRSMNDLLNLGPWKMRWRGLFVPKTWTTEKLLPDFKGTVEM